MRQSTFLWMLESDSKFSCIAPVNTVPLGGQIESLWERYNRRRGWELHSQPSMFLYLLTNRIAFFPSPNFAKGFTIQPFVLEKLPAKKYFRFQPNGLSALALPLNISAGEVVVNLSGQCGQSCRDSRVVFDDASVRIFKSIEIVILDSCSYCVRMLPVVSPLLLFRPSSSWMSPMLEDQHTQGIRNEAF